MGEECVECGIVCMIVDVVECVWCVVLVCVWEVEVL